MGDLPRFIEYAPGLLAADGDKIDDRARGIRWRFRIRSLTNYSWDISVMLDGSVDDTLPPELACRDVSALT